MCSSDLTFTVMGSLTDSEMAAAVAAVTVPMAPNREVSASGSLLTWLAGARRPLAARGDYAVEVAALAPEALWLYDDVDRALAAALAEPGLTRVPHPPAWPDAGAAHAALYRSVARC